MIGRAVVLLLLVGLFLGWLLTHQNPSQLARFTVVIMSSPITVLSWNKSESELTVVKLPEQSAAVGTHGYGTYALEAFWKLGEIDKKDGAVLADTISDVLGIPVASYIGPATEKYQELFSLSTLLPFITREYRTNLSLPEFLGLVWFISFSKPKTIEPFDFSQDPALIANEMTLADNTRQFVIDSTKVDVRLAHVFEDEEVRKEVLTVAVLNTTSRQFLGNRAARVLTNVGVSVVSVRNDNPALDTCTLSGIPRMLETKTAKVITEILNCDPVAVAETEKEDLVVRVGESYAQLFIE